MEYMTTYLINKSIFIQEHEEEKRVIASFFLRKLILGEPPPRVLEGFL